MGRMAESLTESVKRGQDRRRVRALPGTNIGLAQMNGPGIMMAVPL